MDEHHLIVRRTARYYTVGAAAADEVWIVCHGYAQLARRFVRVFAAIDDGTRIIVAPEALNRYYHETAPGMHAPDARIAATWMTGEDREHEIEDYIAYLDQLAAQVAGRRQSRLIALGFSQGAATVSRWAARGSTRIDHVVLWASPPARELEGGAMTARGARLTIAIGTDDEHIPAGEIDRLSAAGYDLFRYSGGHHIDADALTAIAERIRSA